MATLTYTEYAPYCIGDALHVEHNGAWHLGVVTERALTPDHRARFGLRWAMTVQLDTGPVVTIKVDDNGRNHTWRHQVVQASPEENER